jgi:hypothetical protein
LPKYKNYYLNIKSFIMILMPNSSISSPEKNPSNHLHIYQSTFLCCQHGKNNEEDKSLDLVLDLEQARIYTKQCWEMDSRQAVSSYDRWIVDKRSQVMTALII